MALTLTEVTKEPTIYPESQFGPLKLKIVRGDNSAAETTTAADFANYGLATVMYAATYNRTDGAWNAAVITAMTTVTSDTHTAGDDVTLFAWGIPTGLSTLA